MSITAAPCVVKNWEAAFDRCRARLTSREAELILKVSSYEELKVSMHDLQLTYKKRAIPQAVCRIEPLLLNLKEFNHVIDTAISSNPRVVGLVWGGIKLVFEVSVVTR